MLKKYTFVDGHSALVLNRYINHFFFKIRGTNSKSKFIKEYYLHQGLQDILRISRTNELEKKIKAFFDAYKKLDSSKKNQFNELVRLGINIERTYEDISISCSEMQSDNIRLILGNDSLKDLMNHLYTKTFFLKKFELQEHYQLLYKAMEYKICPFCGVEIMLRTRREDYDHIAPKSKYPLIAINLKNLAPACQKCNEKFKHEIDIYYDETGNRRPFAYPYTTEISIDLDFSGSVIEQTDLTNMQGVWKIKILPEIPLTETWNKVFSIEERYKIDYIEAKFRDWVDEFIDSMKLYRITINTEKELVNELNRAADLFYRARFNNLNLIRAPLFRFLGNGELKEFYHSLLLLLKKRYAA